MTITSEIYEEMAEACELLDLAHLTEAQARAAQARGRQAADRWRTAVHECGHALACCLHPDGATYWVRVYVKPEGKGALVRREPSSTFVGETPPLEVRVACDVASAVAESVVLGLVDPVGVWRDLQMAFARVHVTRPPTWATKEAVRKVRKQVAVLGELFAEHCSALIGLAHRLFDVGSMQRDEVLAFLRAADVDMLEAVYAPGEPPEERVRIVGARADFDAMNARRAVDTAATSDAPPVVVDTRPREPVSIESMLTAWAPMLERKIAAGPP